MSPYNRHEKQLQRYGDADARASDAWAGHVYLQLHSESADGNLWGWLLP